MGVCAISLKNSKSSKSLCDKFMNNTNLLHKVNKFLARELFHNVKDVVIFQTHPDGYEFFNKYHVIKERDLYKTYSKYESQIHHFTSLKLAMAKSLFSSINLTLPRE